MEGPRRATASEQSGSGRAGEGAAALPIHTHNVLWIRTHTHTQRVGCDTSTYTLYRYLYSVLVSVEWWPTVTLCVVGTASLLPLYILLLVVQHQDKYGDSNNTHSDSAIPPSTYTY